MSTARFPERASVGHTPGRPQQWSNVDPDVAAWVAHISADIEEVLDGVVGVYLHGSLAIGGYRRPKSDVDLLIVVDRALSGSAKRALAVRLVHAHDQRPTTGSVELSVVQRHHAHAVPHPMPYEMHFSAEWADQVRSGGVGPSGTDPDLAAHFVMARSRGVALRGPAPEELLGDVPRADFWDSIAQDFRWIVEGGIVESPFYGVLNLCRTLHQVTIEPELPPSKDEAGEWAVGWLPAEHAWVVAEALECYRSDSHIAPELRRVHGHRWDEDALRTFADVVRQAVPSALF